MNLKFKKKINVLIFGCGSIGFRHLESLLKSKYNLNIYIIEKNSKTILNLKTQIQFNKNKNINISFYKKIFNFKIPFYLAIIATNSKDRLESLKVLLKNNTVNYLILEKLLSPNLIELKKIKKFISKKKLNIYVNTPRKLMKVYVDIKQQIFKNDLISVDFSGSKWNFTSNAIHFIDLFTYLSDDKNLKKGSARILNKVNSKRNGYSEFYASMYVYNNDGAVLHLSDNEKKSISLLTIKTKKYRFLVYEEFGLYFRISNKNNKDVKICKFKIEYQSTLTHRYFECLYKNMSLNLPTFEESYLQHLLFYELFFREIKQKNLQNISIS